MQPEVEYEFRKGIYADPYKARTNRHVLIKDVIPAIKECYSEAFSKGQALYLNMYGVDCFSSSYARRLIYSVCKMIPLDRECNVPVVIRKATDVVIDDIGRALELFGLVMLIEREKDPKRYSLIGVGVEDEAPSDIQAAFQRVDAKLVSKQLIEHMSDICEPRSATELAHSIRMKRTTVLSHLDKLVRLGICLKAPARNRANGHGYMLKPLQSVREVEV